MKAEGDPFPRYLAAGIGVVVAAWVSMVQIFSGQAEKTAQLGVVLCAATGALSLWLKRRGRSVESGLLAIAVVFLVRMVVVAVGATFAIRKGGGAMPFVYGFFGTYFPLQWVEIAYFVTAAKKGGPQE